MVEWLEHMAEVQAEVRKVAGLNPTQASTTGKLSLSQEVNGYLRFVGRIKGGKRRRLDSASHIRASS